MIYTKTMSSAKYDRDKIVTDIFDRAVLSAGGVCLARTEAERRQPVSEMKQREIERTLRNNSKKGTP